jgi:hypothetical protein
MAMQAIVNIEQETETPRKPQTTTLIVSPFSEK